MRIAVWHNLPSGVGRLTLHTRLLEGATWPRSGWAQIYAAILLSGNRVKRLFIVRQTKIRFGTLWELFPGGVVNLSQFGIQQKK